MTTDRQRAANRGNAKRSTGPRTPEGKAIVSRNALKHGLLSQKVVLDDEDRAAFDEVRDGLLSALAPEGELEQLLADRVVASAWRLGRATQIEKALLASDVSRYEGSLSQVLDGFTRLRGSESGASDERSSSLGLAVADALHRGDRYGKLIRYEGHIERGLYRALHELQRIQAARLGQTSPLPVAIDVEITASASGEAPEGER